MDGEPGRHVSGSHRRVERDGEEVEAILARNVVEERGRLPGDEGQRGDLALAELFERYLLIVIGRRHRDVQKLEEPPGRNRGAGATQIDVHLLVCQVCNTLDVAPGEQMELLVVELGDVGDPGFESREQTLLSRIIEHVGLKDGHVDAAQQLEVGDVLQRSLADDRQHPTCRPVVDDIGEILGDAHRDAGSAPRLEFYDTPVDDRDIRRRSGARRRNRRRKRSDDGGRDDRALHYRHSSLFRL